MACICQECKRDYKIDIIIPDELWEKIKPKDKPKGGGLLCGNCIIDKLEKLLGYNAFKLDYL